MYEAILRSVPPLFVVQDVETLPHALLTLEAEAAVLYKVFLVHLYDVLLPRYYLVYLLLLDPSVGLLL